MSAEPRSTLVLVTPPALAIVTREQAKAHLGVRHADHDELIDGFIAAAVAAIDPAGRGWLGAALGAQGWELRLDRFPCGALELPYPPLLAVGSIAYHDTAGTPQVMAPADYQVAGIGAWRKARLAPAPGGIWPATQCDRLDAVTVAFTCGHDDVADVPPSIVTAVKLMIGHLYENREAAVGPDDLLTEIPLGVAALLANCRIHY